MDDYREYAAGAMDRLRRTAYLLCGDWHTADDLVATVLVRLYRSWRKVGQMENIDAYARRSLLNAWLDERRRPWRREQFVATIPEPLTHNDIGPIADRVTLLSALAELPPRRRAVLVLRYFCDLSVEDTAIALDCSIGTVKSQTARALQTLRARMGSPALSLDGK